MEGGVGERSRALCRNAIGGRRGGAAGVSAIGDSGVPWNGDTLAVSVRNRLVFQGIRRAGLAGLLR